MEKREPSFVPEWLRSSGNSSSVGSKNQTSGSSLTHDSKSRNPRTKTNVDSVRSPILNRSSSAKNAYRNFNFQRRGKDRRIEKDGRSNIDPWDRDSRFPFGTFLNARNQEQLRRSNSMTTRKHDDHLALGFSKDFPRLKTEEGKEGGPDVVRTSSPDLTLAVQSLSVGDSGMTAGEGWTSAPAEVPNVIEKSGSDSVAANVVTSNTLKGQTRNMAEALLQPPRTGTLPQGYPMIKRLEDRALMLRPVVPSAPKGSVSKTKPMVRSGAFGLSSFRNTQKQSSMLLGNLNSNYGSQIKRDSTKKLVVLKPAVKESGGPSRITSSLAAGYQMIAAPSAPFITSVAQTQSRNAFYSALKEKTSTSNLSCVEEKADISKELVASNPSSGQAAERDDGFERADLPDEEEAEFLKSLGWDENNNEVEALTDEEIRAFYEQHKEVKPSLMKKLLIIKEVEFLKSLGWDENNTEVEALTDEEIRAFREQYKEVNPSTPNS